MEGMENCIDIGQKMHIINTNELLHKKLVIISKTELVRWVGASLLF